ncbi:MAG TPA: 4-hydroxy-3-methylbut-2-enyl diphosphate reductase [Gemmataceae bacterium]|nr:4-hydroxy-3-methylbut-2-enyl diphosphate reductase [Gemmataceae bacterium]
MKVIRAEVLGMCFGVRDALKVLEDVERPEQVTIHGELVHNEAVLIQLGARGFRMASENARHELPPTDTVLITAHGVSDVERRRLEAAGKRLVDTTCPLVTRAHTAAQKLQAEGYHVLVIGRRGHVEVQGIVEDLHSFDVIQAPEEVRRYPSRRLGIMCQTTSPARHVECIRAAIAEHNPDADIRFLDTVCHPTKDHQRALERLLEQVEAVVVVGGRNSNNTRELVARCREKNVPAFHVQSAADLDPAWFDGVVTVGLTAGTSTLDETIENVYQALLRMPSVVGYHS